VSPRRTSYRANGDRGSANAAATLHGISAERDVTGDLDSMYFLAGQGVGPVCEVKPAGEIVRELVEEARQVMMSRLPDLAAS
jgi:hypothetical protein